jgi:hypothetical protein
MRERGGRMWVIVPRERSEGNRKKEDSDGNTATGHAAGCAFVGGEPRLPIANEMLAPPPLVFDS